MKVNKKTSVIRIVLITFHYPVDFLSKRIKSFKEHHKLIFKFTFGFVLICCGSFLAGCKQTIIPHYLWDGVSYSIHGFGLAPIIKVVCDFIEVEI